MGENIKLIIVKTLLGTSCMVMFSCTYAQNMNLKEHQMKTSRNELAAQITKYIKKEITKRKIVGLSVAVVDSEGVLISDGFGLANKEKNIRANNSTLFPIASITKTFTGIAIMQLVEKGLIDLDKPISAYIAELSLPNEEENIITTRMLLTHHSGIHGDILYNWYLPTVSSNPLIYEQVVKLINETGTIFEPGKLHSYSNAGYSLLGVLIHKISGMPYPDYIRSHIFEPLGLKKSIVFAGETTNEVIATGYDGKKAIDMPMKLGIPAGGIALTSDEAAIYLQGVLDSYHGKGVLLKEKTMKDMMSRQNQNVPLDEGFSIGFTWFLQDPVGVNTKFAAHRGELPPFHAMLITLPDLNTGVFISVNTNKAASAPEEIAHEIITMLYEYSTGKHICSPSKAEKTSLNTELVKKYEGNYPNVYLGPMKVLAKRNKLLLKSEVMPMPMELVPRTDQTFVMKAKLFGFISLPVKQLEAIQIEFREYEGKKYMYFIIQNSMLNPNIKAEPLNIPEEYKNYKGKYKVINMENSDRVAKNIKLDINSNGKFSILKYTFLGRHKFNLAIRPIDRNNAKIEGLGYFMGDKIKWETSGDKILMYWSGLILEKI